MPAITKPTPKRPADEFTIARRIYQRRRALLEEYAQTLEGIDRRVRVLVEHLEEADAQVEATESPEPDRSLPADFDPPT